jgi:hypothetical protein
MRHAAAVGALTMATASKPTPNEPRAAATEQPTVSSSTIIQFLSGLPEYSIQALAWPQDDARPNSTEWLTNEHPVYRNGCWYHANGNVGVIWSWRCWLYSTGSLTSDDKDEGCYSDFVSRFCFEKGVVEFLVTRKSTHALQATTLPRPYEITSPTSEPDGKSENSKKRQHQENHHGHPQLQSSPSGWFPLVASE